MAFLDDLDKIIPPYLVDNKKDRLKEALKQFAPEYRGSAINYDAFYKSYGHPYFMQADLVREIRMANWNDEKALYEKQYPDAIILSNTCDLSTENHHKANTKQCLFAPLIDFSIFSGYLEKEGYNADKLEQFIRTVKGQLVSNLFYLPAVGPENREYVVMLDRVFWFPINELNGYLDKINDNRIASLSQFGHYLFIMKLSYHLCRLPEQCDREFVVV